jgi:N-acyl-L-homoserine lactone synthetase
MRTLAVTWETVHQHGEAWISHHRLRYKMFVERQKWTIPTYRQIEYDEFDTPAATYILTVDDQYRVLCTAANTHNGSFGHSICVAILNCKGQVVE